MSSSQTLEFPPPEQGQEQTGDKVINGIISDLRTLSHTGVITEDQYRYIVGAMKWNINKFRHRAKPVCPKDEDRDAVTAPGGKGKEHAAAVPRIRDNGQKLAAIRNQGTMEFSPDGGSTTQTHKASSLVEMVPNWPLVVLKCPGCGDDVVVPSPDAWLQHFVKIGPGLDGDK